MEEDGRRPWWMDDPELVALRHCVLEEIENAQSEPVEDGPDPIVADLWSGASTRELSGARGATSSLSLRALRTPWPPRSSPTCRS